MPIDPISLTLIFLSGVIVGATVAAFWEKIEAWAYRVIGYILDSINRAIQVASSACVYLVKQGSRYYKKVEVFVKDTFTGKIFRKYQEEEVSEQEVPDEFKQELRKKSSLLLSKYS